MATSHRLALGITYYFATTNLAGARSTYYNLLPASYKASSCVLLLTTNPTAIDLKQILTKNPSLDAGAIWSEQSVRSVLLHPQSHGLCDARMRPARRRLLARSSRTACAARCATTATVTHRAFRWMVTSMRMVLWSGPTTRAMTATVFTQKSSVPWRIALICCLDAIENLSFKG